MSITPLTVYILAVYGLSNLYTANGKPFPGYTGSFKSKHGGKVHSGAPMQQFQPLDADWLTRLQGEDFQEVEDDGGRGGNSQSGLDTTTESTTASSLGFDFKYLFDKGTDSNKPSTENNWDKPQTDNSHQSDIEKNPLKNNAIFDQMFGAENNWAKPQADNSHQSDIEKNPLKNSAIFDQIFGADDEVKSPHQNSGFFNQNHRVFNHNQLGLGFNNPGFHQRNVPSFNPFAMPFLQVPSFLTGGRRSYSSRHPMFGGHGYGRGLGFAAPPPTFFRGGFGGY